MTIEGFLAKHLTENGLSDDQAGRVLDRYKEEHKDSMGDRWRDSIDGYPVAMRSALILGVNRQAVLWIDENFPKHWARPMFEFEPATNDGTLGACA